MDSFRIVYIAHPISGDVLKNILRLSIIIRNIANNYEGVMPFVPYLAHVISLDDSKEEDRKKGMNYNKALFQEALINEVWLYGDRISSGMQTEIEWARTNSIPVYGMTQETIDQLELYRKTGKWN